MELRINLADREEIAAAIPLLQIILGNADESTGVHAASAMPSHELRAANISQVSDPAAVFGGGAQTAVPLPPGGAPSIAGAVPLPTAHADTMATISAAMSNALVPPAPNGSVPGAPMASTATTSAPATGVILDKNGLPWDERIHASTKTQIKDGSWKAKKGVDAALVSQVEAELRARMGASPAGVPLPPSVGGAVVPAAPTAHPAVPLPPAAPGVPSAVADPTTFETLMSRVTAASVAGVMPATAVGVACTAHGIASIVTLQQQPAFVPIVWATLKQQYPTI